MTPEEKAKELVKKFTTFHAVGYAEEITPDTYTAKKHAEVCVEEIENSLIECGELSDQLQNMDRELNYWQNVRKAIETL